MYVKEDTPIEHYHQTLLFPSEEHFSAYQLIILVLLPAPACIILPLGVSRANNKAKRSEY